MTPSIRINVLRNSISRNYFLQQDFYYCYSSPLALWWPNRYRSITASVLLPAAPGLTGAITTTIQRYLLWTSGIHHIRGHHKNWDKLNVFRMVSRSRVIWRVSSRSGGLSSWSCWLLHSLTRKANWQLMASLGSISHTINDYDTPEKKSKLQRGNRHAERTKDRQLKITNGRNAV